MVSYCLSKKRSHKKPYVNEFSVLLAMHLGLSKMSEPLFDNNIFAGNPTNEPDELERRFADLETLPLIKLVFNFFNQAYRARTFTDTAEADAFLYNFASKMRYPLTHLIDTPENSK